MQKIVKLVLLSAVLVTNPLFAGDFIENCPVDYTIMYGIAKTEKHPKRDVGYPFLISFNNKQDQLKAKELMKGKWLDNRTLDCISVEGCSENLDVLDSLKITNLDLGAFQLCRTYHVFDAQEYFTLKDSYIRACDYLQKRIAHYGYNWFGVASYHSGTEKFNLAYQEKLAKNLKGVLTHDEI